MNILMFGPNGSGKGTQGELIKKIFGIAHIESGAIFREHISKGTALGSQAKSYIDKGELVPDTITIPMILATLRAEGSQGWLLDGFPRNLQQAQELHVAMKQQHITLNYVIEILLPRDIAKNRILGRRICKADNTHPNNTFIESLKPDGNSCRICHSELSVRSDDQDQDAIDKRHDIYYNILTGTLAAANYFKLLADKGETTYIAIDGQGNIEDVNKQLFTALTLRR